MRALTEHLFRLRGVDPIETRKAVASDAQHREIGRFTVAAEECFNAGENYWSNSALVKVGQRIYPDAAWFGYAA